MEENREIIKKIGDLAYLYEEQYGGCAQCVIAAVKNVSGGISDEVFKAATGFAGGIGLSGNNCGALTGAIMVISSYMGRVISNFEDKERVGRENYRLVRLLIERFCDEYGSINCYDIQTKIMGRSYNLTNKEEFKAFLAAGGHKDKCTAVCKNAAVWAAEILMDEKLL